MADERTACEQRPSKWVLAQARAFAGKHGTPTRAVVENIGRGKARVVLVGADGALGDVVVATVAVGEQLAVATPELELSTWDGDTTAALLIGAAHRKNMAASRTRH
ncbi:MAG: hypothetical protein ACRDRN_02410 [Sciscionella sp.]